MAKTISAGRGGRGISRKHPARFEGRVHLLLALAGAGAGVATYLLTDNPLNASLLLLLCAPNVILRGGFLLHNEQPQEPSQESMRDKRIGWTKTNIERVG